MGSEADFVDEGQGSGILLPQVRYADFICVFLQGFFLMLWYFPLCAYVLYLYILKSIIYSFIQLIIYFDGNETRVLVFFSLFCFASFALKQMAKPEVNYCEITKVWKPQLEMSPSDVSPVILTS